MTTTEASGSQLPGRLMLSAQETGLWILWSWMKAVTMTEMVMVAMRRFPREGHLRKNRHLI